MGPQTGDTMVNTSVEHCGLQRETEEGDGRTLKTQTEGAWGGALEC